MADDAADLYRAGLKLHRAKDYAGAVKLLEQAVALDPAHADAFEALGVLHDRLGNVDAAIAATEKLVALKPDEIMAHTNLSRFYVKKGFKERAEEEQAKARLLGWKQELASGAPAGDAALAQAPKPPTMEAGPPQLIDLVSGAAAAGHAPSLPIPDPAAPARRIVQFEALVAHNPDDLLSRFSLGRAYLEAGRFDEAVSMLETLLEKKPNHSAAWLTLGLAYERGGKLARALKTWNRGIEVAQANGDLHPRNQMQEQLARLQGPRAS